MLFMQFTAYCFTFTFTFISLPFGLMPHTTPSVPLVRRDNVRSTRLRFTKQSGTYAGLVSSTVQTPAVTPATCDVSARDAFRRKVTNTPLCPLTSTACCDSRQPYLLNEQASQEKEQQTAELRKSQPQEKAEWVGGEEGPGSTPALNNNRTRVLEREKTFPLGSTAAIGSVSYRLTQLPCTRMNYSRGWHATTRYTETKK